MFVFCHDGVHHDADHGIDHGVDHDADHGADHDGAFIEGHLCHPGHFWPPSRLLAAKCKFEISRESGNRLHTYKCTIVALVGSRWIGSVLCQNKGGNDMRQGSGGGGGGG